MRCNIPVQTACSGVEIRTKPGDKSGTTISVALSIDLPVEDLINALTVFQSSHSPSPQPEELPERGLFEAQKVQPVQGPGYTTPGLKAPEQPMKAAIPQQVMPRETGAARSNLAPPPGLTAQWETLGSNAMCPATGPRSLMTRIKVTNLVRRLKAQEVQAVFERYVGPITACNLVEDAASITFMSAEHAQAAIDRYDGGVMEVRTDKSAPGDPLVLYPKDSTFRRTLEVRLGPLTECHLRRGEGWMTLFRGSITKQLKREEALNQIDYKGSLINIALDVVGAPGAPMAAPPRTPGTRTNPVSVEGLVFGQPMVL